MEYQQLMSQGSGMPLAGQQGSCLFQQPPPRRTYCTPAPFSARSGQKYFNITSAYGMSKPSL